MASSHCGITPYHSFRSRRRLDRKGFQQKNYLVSSPGGVIVESGEHIGHGLLRLATQGFLIGAQKIVGLFVVFEYRLLSV